MNLKQRVAKNHGVNEDQLIWSPVCDNPETINTSGEGERYEQGYWVLR